MSTHSGVNQLSCYLGRVTREKSDEYLRGKKPGTYLIRDSKSIPGDFVLSVSESGKVSHYIINNKGSFYQIGEQTFKDLPKIIEFYRKHFLDSASLCQPVFRVQAQYPFSATDAEDLSFKRNDILVVVEENEENWWTAIDEQGSKGLIPRTYVKMLVDSQQQQERVPPQPPAPHESPRGSLPSQRQSMPPMQSNSRQLDDQQRRQSVPPNRVGHQVHQPPPGQELFVRAIRKHVLPYDDTKLAFEIGDVIKVIKQHDSGVWFGQKDDRTGYFQFANYVEVMQPSEVRDGWNGTA